MVAQCETTIKAKGNNVTAECIANCLLSKSNVFNANGSLKTDVLSAFLIKQTGDAVWDKAITNAVKICVADGAKRADDFAKVAKGAACGPLPLFTIDCVYMQLFKTCPNDRWSSSKYFKELELSCQNLINSHPRFLLQMPSAPPLRITLPSAPWFNGLAN